MLRDEDNFAAFVADTLFRVGKTGGKNLVRKALNTFPDSERRSLVTNEEMYGLEMIGLLSRITTTPEGRQMFASILKQLRDEKYPSETWRTDHFYALATDGDE